MEVWRINELEDTCDGCREDKPLVVGMTIAQRDRSFCRGCARALGLKLITTAGPPALNRVALATQE